MKKIAFLMSLPLVFSAPSVLAQEAATQPTDPAPATAAPAEQAAPAAQDQATPGTNPASAVEAAVTAGLGQYDADGDGILSETEFKTWIASLKANEIKAAGQSINTAEVEAYASAAFVAADQDKDGRVSKNELTGFLGG